MSPHSADVIFQQVSKHYGQAVAVDSISFSAAAGTLTTLLGPSGCGKTTTLRMIAGLDLPTSGSVRIGSEDVTQQPPHLRDVAMVFQSYALFPHMNVGDNVGYGLKMSQVAAEQSRQRVQEALEQVGLTGYEKRLPSELSGGQQQRVAVARALVLQPKVLLFDEPLSNLDARLRRHMRTEIRQLQQSLDLTVVYVTHDQEEAMAVSDQIIVMQQGNIAQQGTPVQLYHEPANRFVANFIGDANLLPAQIHAQSGELAEVSIGDYQLELPHRGLPQGEALVALRPYGIEIQPEHNNGIPGRIDSAAFLGSHTEYTVSTEYGEVFVVDHSAQEMLPVASNIRLTAKHRAAALVSAT